MTKLHELYTRHRAGALALLAAGLCLAVSLALALALVRPAAAKSLAVHISDDYTVMSDPLEPGETVTQTFSTDEDLLALGFVFGLSGDQPAGQLDLTLADADTGEVLARSAGEMANIIPGQYTTLGLDTPVPGEAGRRYLVTLSPRYTGDGRLCVGHSDGAALWEESLTIRGETVDGTLALLATTRRIGGFLTRYFLIVAGLASVTVFFGVRAALRGAVRLPRLVFGLVVAFGLLYSVVLPPYAAPDEKYHINQSFTLACRWANWFSGDEWRMGNVPIEMSYRREHDANAMLQDENTTVFTWQEWADELLTLSPDEFDSHVELAEYQTDRNPILYLASAAGVFAGFVLRLGFVPTLMLGRLCNLLVFAALAAAAVRRAPFGRRVFAAAALLPMTLHLAASFSRDSMLLGLAFLFTALCLEAVFGGEGRPLRPRDLAALAVSGILLAPAKVVYLPLAALFLLIPNLRLGARPVLKKAGYAAACLLLVLGFNGAMLTDSLTAAPEPAAAEQTAGAEQAADTEQAAGAEAARQAPAPAAAVEGYDYYTAIPEEYLTATTEAFVRRLYYCTEPDAQVTDSEVAFWVQALEEGDVTAARLGQSFLFSPTAMEQNTLSDDEFIQAASLIYLDRNVMAEEQARPVFRQQLADKGRTDMFKAFYSSSECHEILDPCGVTVGTEDPSAYPLDRQTLADQVEQARAVRASQSTVAAEDTVTYTPGYVLTHLPATLALVVRSAVADTDDAIRGLVGGLLSYNSLELAWGWVLALYALLGLAALPARGAGDIQLPEGRYRVWCALAALGCAALAVAGCIVWTPVRYETIYGFQGRYLLPALPLAVLAFGPRRIQLADEFRATAALVTALCLTQTGVLLNIMLAVIAR